MVLEVATYSALGRTFCIALLAIINFLFFVLALPFLVTMLSSSTDDTVLINSPNCGYWEDSASLQNVADLTLLENRTWDAVNYVENCYISDAPSFLCDDTLVPRRINWSPDLSAGCPFASGLCWGGDSYAFSMLTDLIDTYIDLGLNSQARDYSCKGRPPVRL